MTLQRPCPKRIQIMAIILKFFINKTDETLGRRFVVMEFLLLAVLTKNRP